MSVSPQTKVYVIICEPGPATAGSKVPLVALVIPVPLHVPPAPAATRLTAASVWQNGPAGVIVASQGAEHKGTSAKELYVSCTPLASDTCIGQFAGGATVVPVPN